MDKNKNKNHNKKNKNKNNNKKIHNKKEDEKEKEKENDLSFNRFRGVLGRFLVVLGRLGGVKVHWTCWCRVVPRPSGGDAGDPP